MKTKAKVGIGDCITVTVTDGNGKQSNVESIDGLPSIIKKYFKDKKVNNNDK